MSLEQDANEVRKSYYREYRQKNKEKIKEYNKAYWEKKAKEMKLKINEV